MPAASRFLFACAFFLCSFALTACQLVPQKPTIAKEPSIVMILPGSGSYVTIAAKIMQGAQAARQELESHGTKIRLVFLDSTKSDWLTKLAALPESFVTVGGPLEPKTYSQLMKSGLLGKRVCFAFMNNLNGSDEGRLAYRFFPSPQDQIDALVHFSTDALKIRSFGALAGTDAYSVKMLNLFEQTLRRRNLPLQKATYTSLDAATLKSQARVLINPSQQGGVNVPQTSFEAVFLPAPWRQLEAMTGAFAANGEDRLVLLGPMSWEQSVVGKSLSSPERFELAVFPGAWNNQAQSAGLGKNADFWTALGYDFVKFAVNLGLAAKLPDADLVARANRAASILRLLAPISWDAEGIAHQKLFIYRATAAGLTRMDVSLFERLRAQRKEKASLRLQRNVEAETLPEEPLAEVPAPKPASMETPPPIPVREPTGGISTVPQSSYKLRLPTRKPAP